jgi:DNA repair photolyase
VAGSNDEFERLLMRLSKQGILSNATIVLGTAVDPFLPFENKFEVSSRFLSLFERYQPARLIVQTRSPLIVIALPVLKRLAKRLIVTVPLETGDDEAMQRYVPGLPNATERLKMMRALRKFGISVIAQVMPLLPYGDWRNDARAFATVLENSADFITLAPLCDGTPSLERRVRNSSIGQRLAAERRFHWLRPDACAPLRAQLETLCPNKLIIPAAVPSVAEQLKFFAA